jgi:hypothetical protein
MHENADRREFVFGSQGRPSRDAGHYPARIASTMRVCVSRESHFHISNRATLLDWAARATSVSMRMPAR